MGEGNRREFFGKLFSGFGGKEAKSTAPMSPPIEDAHFGAAPEEAVVGSGLSRRDLLKGAAALAMASTVEFGAGEASAEEKNNKAEVPLKKLVESKNSVEQTTYETVLLLKDAIEKARAGMPLERESQTIRERDKLHDAVVSTKNSHGKRLADMLPMVVKEIVFLEEKLRKADMIKEADDQIKNLRTIAKLLSECDAYGLVLEGIKDFAYGGNVRLGYTGLDDETKFFYGARANEYLPDPEHINREHIDPRFSKMGDRETVEMIQDAPAWADRALQMRFREYFDKKETAVRVLLQDPKYALSLAEVFSLVKAAIKMEDRQTKHKSAKEDIVKHLLEQRQRIRNIKIIDKTTDEFIYFTYPNSDEEKDEFDSKILDEIVLKIIGDPKKIKKMDTENFHKAYEGDTISPTAPKELQSVRDSICKTISGSSGNTTVYFNTHGGYAEIYLALENSLEANELASALLERVNRTGDSTSLGKMTIILDDCFGYNFVENLSASIEYFAKKKQIAVDALPTIIAASQKGSFGYTGVGMIAGLEDNKKAILRNETLRGEDFLRRIQPYCYEVQDMTFFDGSGGRLIEVGEGDRLENAKKA